MKDDAHRGQLKTNAVLAGKMLEGYFKGGPADPLKIRVASAAITQYQRYLATEGAVRHIDFSIAKTIAKDRQELKKLMAPK